MTSNNSAFRSSGSNRPIKTAPVTDSMPTSGFHCQVKAFTSGPIVAKLTPLPESPPNLRGGRSIDDLVSEWEQDGFADDFAQLRKLDGRKIAEAAGRETLKSLRLKAGLSQTQLAARTGMKQSNIARLESATGANPELATLRSLAAALGVDLNTLGSAFHE